MISIIVLLILATVSISLVINNGILDKAKSAVDKYSEGEITEQIKLAYLECQTEKLSNSNVKEEDFIRDSLREKLNDSNLTVKAKEDKLTVKTTIKGEPKIYVFKSNTGELYEYKDPFDYGGKTKETLVPGDDITLGTEKFRVFYNQDGVIKAMSWYNITLPSNLEIELPIQSLEAGNISFSTSAYWKNTEGWNQNPINNSVDINMTEKNQDGTYKNDIQKYIDGYKKRLENLGDKNVNVRVPQKFELEETGVTGTMRWPSGNGGYWVASAVASNGDNVWCVDRNTRKP